MFLICSRVSFLSSRRAFGAQRGGFDMQSASRPAPADASNARAIYCDDTGVYVWPRTPLIWLYNRPGGGTYFRKVSPLEAWAHVSEWHGPETDGDGIASALISACAYLNSGDPDEARKWIDKIRLPPLTPEGLLKARWMTQPRVPAGSPDGGQWGEDGYQTTQVPAPIKNARTPVRVFLRGVGSTYLDLEFSQMVDLFDQNLQQEGIEVRFTSAYRTRAQQAQLRNDPTARTPAVNSLHSAGLAIDVNYESFNERQQQIIRRVALQAGLSWGGNFPTPDVRHFYFDTGENREKLINNFQNSVNLLER
jgi:hypothetical protein